MNLRVLGCATPFPRRNEPCSGYLILDGESSLLIDCGSGVFGELIEHVDPNDLSGIWISHLHPDHFADMPAVANWALNTGSAKKILVYGPEGWDARLEYFLSGDERSGLSRSIFEIGYISDGMVVDIGQFRLKSRAVRHSVLAFGVRIDSNERSIAYSGDTGPCEALTDLAFRVDLLLCEAGAEKESEYHLTAQQAYEVALSSQTERLLLTHIPRHQKNIDLAKFDALPVEMAHPRADWTI